jgi:hypothetical protein
LTFIFAGIRLGVVFSGTNDELEVRVGDQQNAIVDLRQSIPVSPQIRGTNVFPLANTQDVDGKYGAAIMQFTPKMIADMQAGGQNGMDLGLLRYPGGDVGEKTIISFQQLDQFSKMLNDTHAEGMLQAHIGGPTANGNPHNLGNDVASRAALAGQWVDFMNNPKSNSRTPALKNFHPVKYWSVGNEPDKQINPVTKKVYTVAEYVDVFVQFSKIMHQNNPGIKIFGPELSSFNGVGMGPDDATGNHWMEAFLKGVSDYEKANPALLASIGIKHLLDGVSFHYYPIQSPTIVPSQLMTTPGALEYLIPQLRETIKQTMGYDLPISISEVNAVNSLQTSVPTHGQAALWWADTLGELLNQRVEFVSFFSASGVNAPYPLFDGTGLHDTPMERVMEVFAHLQDNLVPLSIQRNPISVYATQDDSHQTVSLLFVNKSSLPQTAQVNPANNFLGLSPWHSVTISVGGNSVIVLTLHRDGGTTEANYFQAPTTNDNTVGAVNYTACSDTQKKADALDPNIPC